MWVVGWLSYEDTEAHNHVDKDINEQPHTNCETNTLTFIFTELSVNQLLQKMHLGILSNVKQMRTMNAPTIHVKL